MSAFEEGTVAIENDPPKSCAPWKPCHLCNGDGFERCDEGTPKCEACLGLGLALPDEWLGSEWSIVFMLPAESFGPRTPEGFLRLVLDQVYPHGGYRVMPEEHPKFAEAVKFVDASLTKDGIEHSIVDASHGVFKIRSTEKPHGELVRHMRPLLLEMVPPRRALGL